MSGGDEGPPRLAMWLLERFLAGDVREAFIGDLEEVFRETMLAARGTRAARLWFWREVLSAPLTVRRDPALQTASGGDGMLMNLLADVRYALRLLARRPAFTALAAFTLALGIGATTAIFSAVNPILFEPLPYPHPGRVMMVWEMDQDGGKSNLGFPTYRDITKQSTSFETTAAIGGWSATITGRGEPESVNGQRVSYGFFRTFGVAPALGRDFVSADDATSAERVVILSDALWRRRFAGDASLVGKPISLAGVPYTLIGVMPKSFENVLGPQAQMWTTLRYEGEVAPACRTCRHLRMVARLRPGVDEASVNAELSLLARNLDRAYPNDYAKGGLHVVALHDEVTRSVRPALLAVLGAVGLVLLIACANVMNLLLARGVQRQGEFAIRAALGASRVRVMRQLLTESALLSLVGGVLGLGVAVVGVRALVWLSPAGLPRLTAIKVDAHVLLFAFAVTSLVGILFGLLPALHATRSNLHHGINLASRRTTGSARFTRTTLVIGEVALALMLLIGSGLLIRSMQRVFAVASGFDAGHVVAVQIRTAGKTFNEDSAVWRFYDQVVQSVRAVPGVQSAAVTTQLPLSGDFDQQGVRSESHPRANPAEDPSAFRYAVSPGYLETMGIRLRRGRLLNQQDGIGKPFVIVISESFARRVWPGEDPIGQRVQFGSDTWYTIVGVVADVKQTSLSAPESDAFYVPADQWSYASNAMTLVVRTNGDPALLSGALRKAIWSVDKDQPIVRVATMDELRVVSEAQRRFALILFECFAGIAALLAAAGIYGVLAGSVAERVREIGVRSALGASRSDILSMIVREGLGMTLIGVVIGIIGAMVSSRVLAGLLFGVSGLDAVTYGSVTVLLGVIALIACAIPAWRAARVDPAVTLRAD